MKKFLIFFVLITFSLKEVFGEKGTSTELFGNADEIKLVSRNNNAGAEKCQSKEQIGNWSDLACGKESKCVKYFLCSDDGTINTYGNLLIDERSDSSNFSSNPCKSLETCCRAKDFKCIKIPIENLIKNPDENAGGEETDIAKPNDKDPEKPLCKPNLLTRKSATCGKSNRNGLFGELRSYENKTSYAQYAEFPWMLALLLKVQQGSQHVSTFLGGASLITAKVALTAAHKVHAHTHSPTNLFVRGGEWNTRTFNEVCDHVDIDVKKVIVHEKFNYYLKNFRFGIALLVLEKNFQLNSIINIACLPPPNMKFDGENCFGIGWGKTYFGSEAVYQNFLKKVDLPVVNHEECQTRLRDSRLGRDFDLHEGFLCAGGEIGKDTCTGE
jgi:hypothetical protein